MSDQDIHADILAALRDADRYHHCMHLYVGDDYVDFVLDTGISTLGEWIPGEGADMCLWREQDTHRIVGVRLPLRNRRLGISHLGPIRINSGFLREDGE